MVAFLSWSAEIFSPVSQPIFEIILLLKERLDFMTVMFNPLIANDTILPLEAVNVVTWVKW